MLHLIDYLVGPASAWSKQRCGMLPRGLSRVSLPRGRLPLTCFEFSLRQHWRVLLFGFRPPRARSPPIFKHRIIGVTAVRAARLTTESTVGGSRVLCRSASPPAKFHAHAAMIPCPRLFACAICSSRELFCLLRLTAIYLSLHLSACASMR